MKTFFKIFAVSFLLCLFFIISSFVRKENPVETTSMSFQDALTKKKITFTASNNGEYAGASIVVNIKNLSNSPLKITIPAGTIFHPTNDEDQDLIIPQEEVINLVAQGLKKPVLNGFCIQASESSPEAIAVKKWSKTSNDKMTKLITYLAGKKINHDDLQAALWSVSDDRSINNIGLDNTENKALRKFLSTLTGQKEEWFSSQKSYTVSETRQIQSAPMKISGTLDFISDGVTKIKVGIYKRDGTLIRMNPEHLFTWKGKVENDFTIQVVGWEVGKYEVRIFKGETVVKTLPFELS